MFYEKLIRTSPALGARVGYAAAVGEASRPETGISVLDAIEPEVVSNYQPYWAVRAHLLQRLGKTREASDAYDRAIGLAEDLAREGVSTPETRLVLPTVLDQKSL